jgi:hypothetical protein
MENPMTDDVATTLPSERESGRPDDGPTTLGAAWRRSLARSGGVTGIVAAAAPAVAFVVADALGGLTWAFVALAVAAPVAFGVRLAAGSRCAARWSASPSPASAPPSPPSRARPAPSSCSPR